ncbi:MAG: MBL fold metallo-hydrolase [Dehalococcoidia bacterium]
MAEAQESELVVRGIVVGVFAENCWIIGSQQTHEGIVIDPGDQAADILRLAGEMGLDIKVIANTHAHIDHILGVRGVQEATGAKFLLHSQELENARGSVQAAAQLVGQSVEAPPEPDALLDEGDEVEVAGVKLKVIHTPGHTPGSVSFYTDGLLFCGDTLFRGSIGRTDLPGGDYGQEMASIVDRLLALPDDTIVLPGHMQETKIGIERQSNPFVLEELARRRSG